MRMILCLLAIMTFHSQQLISEGVDEGFVATCCLVAEAAIPNDEVYDLYTQGLNAVDAVAAGESDTTTALAALQSLSAELRAFAPSALEPTDEAKAFLTERSLSLEDFQAAVNDAVLSAGYYADTLDGYIQYWEETPGAAAPDTRLMRLGLQYEQKLTFIAFNTLLLPQTDLESKAINLLVVNSSPFLKGTGLAWERDYALCMAKYDAMEAEYADAVDKLQTTLNEAEDALDTAAP